MSNPHRRIVFYWDQEEPTSHWAEVALLACLLGHVGNVIGGEGRRGAQMSVLDQSRRRRMQVDRLVVVSTECISHQPLDG